MKKFGMATLFLLALLLFCFPDAALSGAYSALLLCATKIIPSLFPFFVLSGLFIGSGIATSLGRRLRFLMRPLFGVSGEAAIPFLLGILGGYPVGIRTAADLYRRGEISDTDYVRLAGYCNNSGPLFILGTVGVGMFGDKHIGWLLLLSHILAALCTAFLFRFYIPKTHPSPTCIPTEMPKSSLLLGAVDSSIWSILTVCAYVVLFGALIGILTAAGGLALIGKLFPVAPMALSAGVFEMTGGLSALPHTLPAGVLMPLAGALIGWGGLSVHLQAVSMMSRDAYVPPTYLIGKLLSSVLTALFAFFFSRFVPEVLPVLYTGIYPKIITPKMLTLALILYLVIASLLFRWFATKKHPPA